MDRTSAIRRVLVITLVLNVVVSAAKVVYGHLINSVSMMSDGYHSLFDGVSNVVGLVGVYISSHPPDEKHPYGHRKYETFFTVFVGVLMFITCIEIFKGVYSSLTAGKTAVVTAEAFLIMLVTLAVNIGVSGYERKRGRQLGSEYLLADSMHTQSDIFVSLGVISGLVLTRLGVPLADPVVGAIVGILVAKAGIGVIRGAAQTLVDETQADTSQVRDLVCTVQGVVDCHGIRTRGTKSHIFVDLHVLVNPAMSIEEAHRIADLVEEAIKERIPGVVDVVVHIEPSSSGLP
ncbi:MAG: cation diffusion facilitator family transporter [Thermodesulfovibrionales bacterium]|jgi:cation diffusion facilitator family transporter